MKLIKGTDLTPKQTQQVLCAYIYRWTTGNCARVRVWEKLPKPKMALISDHEWLRIHAFWFVDDLSRPAKRRRHAEPAYLAADYSCGAWKHDCQHRGSDGKNMETRKPTMYSEEWFNECFSNSVDGTPYDIPADIRRAAEHIVRSYGIKGVCDPMYIANSIALELGFGDGQSHFEKRK